jgi:hypothetical protein
MASPSQSEPHSVALCSSGESSRCSSRVLVMCTQRCSIRPGAAGALKPHARAALALVLSCTVPASRVPHPDMR